MEETMSIEVLKYIIESTPNDMELGEKLRRWYWNNHNNKIQ